MGFYGREALKQFDYDYDVLYVLAKDKNIESTKTFEQLLLQYITKKEMSDLINIMPTLTLFVPALPQNIFSAELWDTSLDIPSVAYKDMKGKILFVDSNGDIDDTFSDDEIPLFPVVVVKPSERVFVKSTLTRSVDDTNIFETSDGIVYAFEYSEFNNLHPATTRLNRDKSIPQKMQKVFAAKKYADSNDIWQRDYIYYNIIAKDGKGALCRNISECLYAFQLTGDPKNMYNHVSDQSDDPYYGTTTYTRDHSGGWYNGNYEFLVKIYVSNDQLVSNEIVKGLSVHPEKLFQFKLKTDDRSGRILGIQSLRKYYLPEPLPLFDWDIEHYSTAIKISIEEKDQDVTEQTVVETTTTFATNFGFDIDFGTAVKKGAKFGASASRDRKVSTTITRTFGNDELGDVIVNFGDDVLIKSEVENMNPSIGSSTREPIPIYQPVFNPKYNSGYYKIEIVPLEIY